MALQIVANVPGLQNTGAMWAEEFTGFLLYFSSTQLITDRRLFHLTDEGDLALVVGTFVDDCKGRDAVGDQGGRVQQGTRPQATSWGS